MGGSVINKDAPCARGTNVFAMEFVKAFEVVLQIRNGPRQANLVLIAYASSEGSGEPAHPRSLARTFTARSYKQWIKRNRLTESQIPGPSEWLKFVMTECSKTQIRLTGLKS